MSAIFVNSMANLVRFEVYASFTEPFPFAFLEIIQIAEG